MRYNSAARLLSMGNIIMRCNDPQGNLCAPWDFSKLSGPPATMTEFRRTANSPDGKKGHCRIPFFPTGGRYYISQPMCYNDDANTKFAYCAMPGVFTLILSRDTPVLVRSQELK